jgi:hypothetical protein
MFGVARRGILVDVTFLIRCPIIKLNCYPLRTLNNIPFLHPPWIFLTLTVGSTWSRVPLLLLYFLINFVWVAVRIWEEFQKFNNFFYEFPISTWIAWISD